MSRSFPSKSVCMCRDGAGDRGKKRTPGRRNNKVLETGKHGSLKI